jgi:tRNA threonylcarbamoyl adenosine modification protein (Sua5/YciO/YrdC/YwlC family)
VTAPLEDAVAAAARGELVVFPTDTVYGLGTRPDDPAATGRVFAAKRRPRDLELPVLVASLDQARRVGAFDERAERLAGAFWPGALTLIVPRAEAAVGWDLGGDPTTVGVRMPHHVLALALLASIGPLAVTSANRSGEATPSDCDELVRAFGDLVAIYLCQPEPPAGSPSTVLDVTGPEPLVLREGALRERELAAFLA